MMCQECIKQATQFLRITGPPLSGKVMLLARCNDHSMSPEHIKSSIDLGRYTFQILTKKEFLIAQVTES